MKNTKSILIVDDNPTNLQILTENLRNWGFDLMVAKNGQSGLRIAKNGHPDLILLDIYMPGMDGFEVCKILKNDSATSAIPVIFLTANTDHAAKVKGLNMQAVDYITKPFQSDEVLARINRHIEIYSLQRELQANNLRLQREISKRRQIEIQLQKAKKTAESAARFKSELLSNMSHELRTPLTAVIGFSEILLEGKNLTNDQIEHITTINRSGNNLLNMINSILEMSKFESGHTETEESIFNLWQFLAEIEKMFRILAEKKNLSLVFCNNFQPSLGIQTDKQKLNQILINLIDNAIKFTEHGQIQINVNLIDKFSDSHEFVFEVSDSGIGMHEDEMRNIFEPFVRISESRQSYTGTGLGLAISKNFASLLGGGLSVKSKIGQGSLFSLKIPARVIYSDDALIHKEPLANQIIGLAPAQNHKKILFLDDNDNNQLVFFAILTQLGFEIRIAKNELDAIKIFKSYLPNLVLIDIQSHGFDAFETARNLRTLDNVHKTKIVGISLPDMDSENNKLSQPWDDFLVKPIRKTPLLEKLRKLLNIKYVYANQEDSTIQKKSLDTNEYIFDNEFLAHLPSNFKQDLETSAHRADIDLALKTIEKIKPLNELLASALAGLVNDFRFDKILALLSSKY